MDGMLRRMPASLLAEWIAFDELEPIALGYRGDVQAGIVASVIANVNRDVKRRKDPYTADEFMPVWGEGRTALRPYGDPDPEEVWTKVRIWAGRYKN